MINSANYLLTTAMKSPECSTLKATPQCAALENATKPSWGKVADCFKSATKACDEKLTGVQDFVKKTCAFNEDEQKAADMALKKMKGEIYERKSICFFYLN